MSPKTYEATTMSDALADVKRELGRDAVILHTRSVRKGGVLGLFGGRSVWEVTAAPNVNVLSRPLQGEYVSVAVDDGSRDEEFCAVDASPAPKKTGRKSRLPG